MISRATEPSAVVEVNFCVRSHVIGTGAERRHPNCVTFRRSDLDRSTPVPYVPVTTRRSSALNSHTPIMTRKTRGAFGVGDVTTTSHLDDVVSDAHSREAGMRHRPAQPAGGDQKAPLAKVIKRGALASRGGDPASSRLRFPVFNPVLALASKRRGYHAS